MPEWLMAVVLQLPLVSVVAWAFVSGNIHTDAELTRREAEHLKAIGDWQKAIADWKTLYERERSDRIDSAARLAAGTEAIRDVMARVDDLTREVIRNAPR